ncbi:MAG: hypothetical protein KGL39_15370 [Patescibacteria group bacterium]|nr:hypothetical protein [Patescibacteria group bacterium]
MLYKLGRLPRARNAWFPHYSALRAGALAVPVPPSVDYTAAIPAALGVMLNDSLGDCAEAGYYHAEQVWSANANPPMVTAPDASVEQLYSEATGYTPGNPSSDRGTLLQSLLAYLVKTGAPMGQAVPRHKILGAYEVDPRNAADLNLATWEGGLLYLGFNVPGYLMQGLTAPGSLWDVSPSGDQSIVGGHCVISARYAADGSRGIISWGSKDYAMTEAFWAKYVDEAYVIVTQDWVQSTGRTPGGLTLAQLRAQMQAAFAAAA